MADVSALEVPEEAIEAAATAARKHFEMPFMARTRNFTDEQIAAGELRAADLEADRMNRDAVASVVEAAAPLIVAAATEPAVKRLMILAQKIVTQASQSSRAGQMEALEAIASEVAEVAQDMHRSASVLRGEEATHD